MHLAIWAPAASALVKVVAGVKARGDRAGAARLLKRYVDGSIVPMDVIRKRMGRYPKRSFVYSLGL